MLSVVKKTMLEKLIGDIIKAFASFQNTSILDIISIISLVGAIGCYAAYKFIRKKHLEDPDFVAREDARERAYRQKVAADVKKQSLDDDTFAELDEHLKAFNEIDWEEELEDDQDL